MAEVARARPWLARGLLGLLLILSLWGAIDGIMPKPKPGPEPPHWMRDSALYQDVDRRVGTGESYYVAAPAEHRRRGIPLQPVVTVRPPVLAVIVGALGEPTAFALQCLIALAAFVLLALRLTNATGSKLATYGALTIAALATAVLIAPDNAVIHDVWAGLLVALALMLRTPERWLASVVVALLAAVMRELAAPFLLVMMAAALFERRWREAAAWGATIAFAAGFLMLHWHWVAAVTSASDVVSDGWVRARGWPGVIATCTHGTGLVLLPLALGGALVPWAVAGWATVERGLAIRATLWLAGMMAMFCVIGRTNNLYWGALIAPLLPVGIAFAPRALTIVLRAAR